MRAFRNNQIYFWNEKVPIVKLDVYEGMPHVFQFTLYNTPESKVAISKMNDFLKQYLNY
jgi:acetyl esterase/lipase